MNTILFGRLKSRTIKDENGCWIWQGSKTKAGYGKLSVNGKLMDTHRAMYLAVNDEIQPGAYICHTCDNKTCINPLHLFSGTQRDNIHDMISKGRHSNGEQHSKAIRKGWTEEKRNRFSENARLRNQKRREALAVAAGFPKDWKLCSKCQTWKSPDDYFSNRCRYDGLDVYCRSCRRSS